MLADDVKDIIIFIIGAIFTGGLTALVNWYRARQTAKNARIKLETDAQIALKQEDDKHEIDSGKLALEFIQELRGRIDQQNDTISKLTTRIISLEGENVTQRMAAIEKDSRIAELERKTKEQEEEILELRQIIAGKDEMIDRLNARLDTLERGRSNPGRTK